MTSVEKTIKGKLLQTILEATTGEEIHRAICAYKDFAMALSIEAETKRLSKRTKSNGLRMP